MFTLAAFQPGDAEITTALVSLPLSMAANVVAGVLESMGPGGVAVALEGIPYPAEVQAAIGQALAS